MRTIMKFTIVFAAALIGMALFTSDDALATADDRRFIIGDREIVRGVLIDRDDREFVPRRVIRPFFNPFINIDDVFDDVFFDDDLFFEEERFFFNERGFIRERERDERDD